MPRYQSQPWSSCTVPLVQACLVFLVHVRMSRCPSLMVRESHTKNAVYRSRSLIFSLLLIAFIECSCGNVRKAPDLYSSVAQLCLIHISLCFSGPAWTSIVLRRCRFEHSAILSELKVLFETKETSGRESPSIQSAAFMLFLCRCSIAALENQEWPARHFDKGIKEHRVQGTDMIEGGVLGS